MANSLFSITRWRPVLAALSFVGALFAAETKSALEKNAPGNYNIPLWEEGKVPLARGNGLLDNPFLTVSLPPAGKSNGGRKIGRTNSGANATCGSPGIRPSPNPLRTIKTG